MPYCSRTTTGLGPRLTSIRLTSTCPLANLSPSCTVRLGSFGTFTIALGTPSTSATPVISILCATVGSGSFGNSGLNLGAGTGPGKVVFPGAVGAIRAGGVTLLGGVAAVRAGGVTFLGGVAAVRAGGVTLLGGVAAVRAGGVTLLGGVAAVRAGGVTLLGGLRAIRTGGVTLLDGTGGLGVEPGRRGEGNRFPFGGDG